MASYLVFHCFQETADSKPETGTLRVPIENQSLPAAVQTVVTAVKALFGGNSAAFLSTAGIDHITLEIEDIADSVSDVPGDVRNQWTFSAGAGDPVRFSMPGRNPIPALLAPGSKGALGLLSAAAFDNFLTAITATAGARLVNPETSILIPKAQILQARSTVSPRVSPRV